MAITLDVASIFPEGTSLEVHTALSQVSSGGPLGEPSATGTVSAGEVTFDGLTEDEQYIAFGLVESEWRRCGFSADTAAEVSIDDAVAVLQGQVSDLASAADALAADVAVIGEPLNLATDGSDQAAVIQAASDNLESQGGGKILLPGTGSGAIGLASQVAFGDFVAVEGQGKHETVLRCASAGAGFVFNDLGGSYGYYGGESGGFTIDGNNVASVLMTVGSVDRNFRDVRLLTPKGAGGIALKVKSAQNCTFTGFDAEDSSHSGSRTTYGIVLDEGAAGCNFYSTALNEFTARHVLIDASAENAVVGDISRNINFDGFMIERTDTGNPLVEIKAGEFIHFNNGNFAAREFTPSDWYDIVRINNTAARSYSTLGSGVGVTRDVSFHTVSFDGQTGASHGSPSTTCYARAVSVAADCNPWSRTAYIDESCTFTNVYSAAYIASATGMVTARGLDNAAGGGLVVWSDPAGSGKINTTIRDSAATFPVKAVCDYYEIANTTTITSATATYAGHRIIFNLTGTAQITDGSNLKLNGNFTGGAGRTMELVCDGTNWWELSRSTT